MTNTIASQSEHHSFSVAFAEKYGVHEAIMIHHFQYWINFNKRMGRNRHDGRTWSYQTRKEIAAWFPYLSHDQVRRLTDRLVELKILRKGNYNKLNMDKTIWYSFEDERIFTIGKSANSSGKSANPIAESAKAIPDTKQTESKQQIKKVNEESMTFSSKKKIEEISENKTLQPKQITNPRNFLKEKDELSLYDRLFKFVPEVGDKLKPSEISWWIKQYGVEKVRKAMLVYLQQVEKAKKNTSLEMPGSKKSAGAYIRSNLDNQTEPTTDFQIENKKFAQKMAREHPEIEIKEKYLNLPCGFGDLYYNLPAEIFKKTLTEKIERLKEYE